jgi:beta-lactamase class D
MFKRLLVTLISLLCFSEAFCRSLNEKPSLQTHFEKAGVTGTFVLYHRVEDQFLVGNSKRAKVRFFPASTFKVANALIALDTGAVKDLEEIIPYGGTKEYFKNWEQDMTIGQAMRTSNVAVFHTIAKRIGLATYREKLSAFSYGNADPGASIDNRFWLTGPLKISAMEQVEFIRKLTSRELDIKRSSFLAVRSMIEVEKTDTYTIFAKTGWAGPDEPQIGWWVGWVEKNGMSYPFALNIDIKKDEDAPKRMEIGKACLKELLNLP